MENINTRQQWRNRFEKLLGEFKQNLDNFVAGIQSAGQEKFYSVAKKIQMIPRYMKMAWLEEAAEEHNMTEMIDTAILLDRPIPGIAEVAVQNSDPNHPLAVLSCDQIKKVKTEEMMEVYAMLRCVNNIPDVLYNR